MENLNTILSINLENANKETQEEIYAVLIEANFNDFPKRYYRKILQLTLMSLRYKGEQVITLQDEFELLSRVTTEKNKSGNEICLEEIDRLKENINKLESEKSSLKIKLKEMGEEIIILQNRIHEITINESEDDSNDPLSDLDKHEELLKKISTKNKHIKRLIRDIEALQIQNIEQSQTIIQLKQKSQSITSEKLEFQSQVVIWENEKNQLESYINELTSEISRLESNVTYLEEEREKADVELKYFIEKLEERARSWRKLIDEKEKQLNSLKTNYEILRSEHPKKINNAEQEFEIEKLTEAIQDRDIIIVELENKIKNMAEEMIASTRLMNQISEEREAEKLVDKKPNRNCCKIIQDSLNSLQERYNELSNMMEKIEEDNILKSKQAASFLKLLDEFQKGDDAFGNSLRKITNLESKIASRDQQIKALVMEINSLQELSQENYILRKKLNIPEDETVLTRNLIAKQRNKDKMLDRLTLKFRASEEMRLQLKLEKTELKKEIIELQKKITDPFSSHKVNEQHAIKEEFNLRNEIYCDNCLKNIQSIPNQENLVKTVIKEWEEKYSEVIEENENLRVGMHEILEKIRDYDASSDHITIDCGILEKVLHALDARSICGWYHPAMRIQNELIAVKEREHALKEKIQFVKKSVKSLEQVSNSIPYNNEIMNTNNEDQEKSVIKESQTEKNEENEIEEEEIAEITAIKDHPELVEQETTLKDNIEAKPKDFITMLVEKSFEQEMYKNELSKLIEKNRDLQVEIENLKIYKVKFLECVDEMKKSQTEITNYCASLVDHLTTTEIKLKNQNKQYEFLKEDFDKNLSDFKFSENINISLIADLKKQINNKKHEINLIKLVENRRKDYVNAKDEILILKKKYSKIEIELANIVAILFKDDNHQYLNSEIGSNFGVIKDDMQLDFLTTEEYEHMTNIKKNLEEDNDRLKIKCDQLEELLLISQEQIKSQQKLISEITDNHIELRHLVADLQSCSEDKFIITKAYKDIAILKKECITLRNENEILEQKVKAEQEKIKISTENFEVLRNQIEKKYSNNELKLKFLKKYIFSLQEKYCKYTPLISLRDFSSLYVKFLNKSKDQSSNEENYVAKINELITNKLTNIQNLNNSDDIVKLVQYEVKCAFLEDQLKLKKNKLNILEKELNEVQLIALEADEHWKTIKALFGEVNEVTETKNVSIQTCEKEYNDSAVNTDSFEEVVKKLVSEPSTADIEVQVPTPTQKQSLERQDTIIIQPAPKPQFSFDKTEIPEITSLENQLQQAKNLASKRSALLLNAENKLAEANGRIKEMDAIIDEQRKTTKTENFKVEKSSSGIIEATITSLQSLLSEKDTTLNHYQELLKTEREQHLKSCETYEKEINSIKKMSVDNENTIQKKIEEILDLKNQIEKFNKMSIFNNGSNEKALSNEEFDQNYDNSLNEISDEKIEEMFLDESKNLTPSTTAHLLLDFSNPEECSINKLQQFQLQLCELKSRELMWESTIRGKEEEISLLKEKLTILQEREKVGICENTEIDQVKIILEEKDKHINDLMETLTSFHDDQQRFLNETSLYSADQMTQLGANLNRCEATNKILQTQLDALKKQLAALSQREKQSRDLANSLRNQLIKRPVVSIKSELNSRTKIEQQQKRIQYLEMELETAKHEIQQQQNIIDTKRAKNTHEVSMWEKQKRYQQNAEKLKIKLEETEKSLDKTRSLLNAARTTINRLEKDKNMLQASSLKGVRTTNSFYDDGTILHKCCQNSSCPNFQMVKIEPHFENIENITNYQSENNIDRTRAHNISCEYVDDLKSKIEAQQRRIYAFEIGSNGSNAIISEIEKLQEKITTLEAQNIRWEAKNLQLQLDLDLIRQSDENERNKKRIKYLEDYIIALKEELAQAEAQKEYESISDNSKKLTTSQAEQTILALKRIVERLKNENKNLKEGRTSHYICRNDKDSSTSELSKLKHLYTESMNKISALQIEIQLRNNCRETNGKTSIVTRDGDIMRELKYVKEQLIKKTQLLEKAKILLTRAAAKEKSLKDQVIIWKRKCSELQNVPVIEEISE